MTARVGSTTCCDFCPRAHTRECLTRHSTEVCTSARQHVAAHRARRSGGDRGVKHDGEERREKRTSDSDAVMSDETSCVERRAAVARARAEMEDKRRTEGVDDVAHRLRHYAPFVPSADEDFSTDARRRARESIKRTPELSATEAHDRAFLVRGAKRVPGSSTQIDVGPPTGASAAMPVTSQWLGAKLPSFSEAQLKRMIVEMTAVNKRKWSHETVTSVTGGPRGSVTSVLTSLARGSLSEGESDAFKDIDFGDVEDPLVPDWQSLEEAGVLPALREAKAAIYAPGSLPKLRTALNHWLKYTATKARVGFLRPRVNDDPEAFMIESLLRQGFVADLVSNGGCNVDTAEQYAALFNSWHIDVMGYGMVATKSFDDPQFKRTNQGLRRLHPAKRIDRAAHPIEINAPVLRSSLSRIMEIYDEAGEVTATRWRRIEKEFESGAQGGFNKDTVKDLVFSAVTELATDGLLRPGEILSKSDPIRQSDVSFDHDRDGRLVSATVMITPIKRYHKHVGDKNKCPIVIKAHRGGALRTAELLEILNMIAPCLPGEEKTTQLLRFPVERTVGLKKGEAQSMRNLTLRKVMVWYHAKCEAAGIAHHERVKPHSFRIGGATALFGANVTAEEIKAMGRWFSDVYRIYCRLSKERLLDLSSRMSNSRSTQFLDGQAGFMHTGLDPALQQALDSNLLDVEPVEQVAPDEANSQAAEETELADDDSDFGDESGDGDDSDGSDTESAVLCDPGSLLTDAQISVGASVAVPFSLDGRQVHFEGTISSTTSSSEVGVAFPGERPWVVARDRLFEVVALAAKSSSRSHQRSESTRGTPTQVLESNPPV